MVVSLAGGGRYFWLTRTSSRPARMQNRHWTEQMHSSDWRLDNNNNNAAREETGEVVPIYQSIYSESIQFLVA